MTLVLDAGAFVALERGDRAMWRRLKNARLSSETSRTHGGVVAQVWRGGAGCQVPLAKAMRSVDIVPLDDHLGRAAGVLLARSRTSDAVDAAVVAMTLPGDRIVTSDPDDISDLLAASGRRVDIIPT